MDIRDVIVVADSTAATGHRLDLASRLASKFGWRLTGVAMDQTGMLADPTTPDPFNLPLVSSGLLDFFEGEGKEMLEEDVPPSVPHKEPFNVMVDGRPIAWRSFSPDDVSGVARLARIADLIILGQDDSASAKEPGRIVPEDIILSCGGPCLVIPFAGTFNSIGEHVLLAWDGSREAARALRDAKGFLRKAGKVTVVTVDSAGSISNNQAPGLDELVARLADQGINVSGKEAVGKPEKTADILLNNVSDLSADLLVTGSFHHSRAMETLLGGVTRDLLRQMTVPVFMSH